MNKLFKTCRIIVFLALTYFIILMPVYNTYIEPLISYQEKKKHDKKIAHIQNSLEANEIYRLSAKASFNQDNGGSAKSFSAFKKQSEGKKYSY